MPREIFVFGSNLAGRHASGAARAAVLDYGAVNGCGVGIQGNSYAIPTLDHFLKPLRLSAIKQYVLCFFDYACCHTELIFNVTPIGCGLAGYAYTDIAPMFKLATYLPNVQLPEEFKELL